MVAEHGGSEPMTSAAVAFSTITRNHAPSRGHGRRRRDRRRRGRLGRALQPRLCWPQAADAENRPLRRHVGQVRPAGSARPSPREAHRPSSPRTPRTTGSTTSTGHHRALSGVEIHPDDFRFSFAYSAPTMLPLTKRQREILDYLNDFIQQHGYAPSPEEIRRRFGLSSLATVPCID